MPEPKPDLRLKRPSSEPDKPPVPKIEKPQPVEEPKTGKSGDAYNPKNPFGGIVSAERTEPRDQPPPELPSPPPIVNDGSIQKIEEAIDSIGESKKSNSALISVLVILFLLALLGGAGYGMYYVLQPLSSNTDAEVGKSEESSTSDKSGNLLSNPIAKAKAAIASIPSSSVEESIPTEETYEEVAAKPEPEPEPSAPPLEVIQRGNDSASKFLTDVHVGGVRSGERPKVILNGESYVPGDLVDERFGLRFIGLRDGKLAFRDETGIVYVKSF